MTLRTNQNLTLLTDLYQLTMAQAYFKSDMSESIATFHLFFRKNPFAGNYAIAAGISDAIEVLENYGFGREDIDFLKALKGNDGQALFENDFLEYLEKDNFNCSVSAMREGEVVFAHEPILKITGPIIQCQILESLLLNIINFQTLVATKAARVVKAARGGQVAEFGLRRAQGVDGSLAATKASYIGGVDSTSSVLAAKLFGIPVKGTHAHSWVMSLPSELQAFELYAKAMPNNCVFLVDTYDTLEGVRNACKIGDKLKKSGHKMIGVRLDSGDLAKLSAQAREILDQQGHKEALIFASNDLDEYRIEDLMKNGAKVDVWGVGTKLVSSYDQPALGGVYKLGAIRRKGKNSPLEYKIKLSEDFIKISTPGSLQVRRFFDEKGALFDVLYNTEDEKAIETAIDTGASETKIDLEKKKNFKDLLVPIFEEGRYIGRRHTLEEARNLREKSTSQFSSEIISNHKAQRSYQVLLEERLFQLKSGLVNKSKIKGGL